jgi:hypothetical protein
LFTILSNNSRKWCQISPEARCGTFGALGFFLQDFSKSFYLCILSFLFRPKNKISSVSGATRNCSRMWIVRWELWLVRPV